MSPRARPPAVAGLFYPASAGALAGLVDRLLRSAGDMGEGPLAAVVAPHAGLVYSGPVAACAYAAVRQRAPGTRRVVLLGPSHFVPLRGAAVPTHDAAPHEREHALEVQLPFLQRALPGPPPVLPVAVGTMAPGDVADLIGALAEADGTLVVVSTDLSHTLDDEAARARDRETAAAIVARKPESVGDGAACGAHALRGLLEHARRRGLTVEQLALATSADTSGDHERVVGYGAFALAPPHD